MNANMKCGVNVGRAIPWESRGPDGKNTRSRLFPCFLVGGVSFGAEDLGVRVA